MMDNLDKAPSTLKTLRHKLEKELQSASEIWLWLQKSYL